jgi:glycerol-3-phosphate dehydrogenase (NAD(P)+)
MAVITVVGAGVMGTAITFPAADNGHEVHLIGTHLDDAIIESCRQNRYHPNLKRAIPDGVQVYTHDAVPTVVPQADVIVLGVNSRGVHWAAEALGAHLRPGQTTLMVTKGLEGDADGALHILPDVFAAGLPASLRDQIHYAAVGGPSIAGELAARRDTSVVFASREASILPGLRDLFATSYYHIWTSTDLIGVEVCVALKNIFALAVGLAQGKLETETPPDVAGAKMHNVAAAIFAQGLAETAYLVQKMGGSLETVFSLPGAGDLYVTSQGGRNSRMGRLLGMGMPYSSAVEEMPDETVEGVDAVLQVIPAVDRMIGQGTFDADAMPLMQHLYQILTRNTEVALDFDQFFSKLPFNPPVNRTTRAV